MNKNVGSWRKTSAGKWVVAVNPEGLTLINGRATVKVMTRSGRCEDVTVWKLGSPFMDSRTKTLTVYGHPCMRTASVHA